MNEEYIKIISIVFSIIIAFMGWIMQRKTERIKIMENQLSEKKYAAYASLVGLFYSILKDVKKEKDYNQTKIQNNKMLEEMLESKKNIFMYGSDNVIKAFNKWLCSTTKNESKEAQLDAFLDFMIEIRKDMSGKSTKISKKDLLINLIQNDDEANNFLNKISITRK